MTPPKTLFGLSQNFQEIKSHLSIRLRVPYSSIYLRYSSKRDYRSTSYGVDDWSLLLVTDHCCTYIHISYSTLFLNI